MLTAAYVIPVATETSRSSIIFSDFMSNEIACRRSLNKEVLWLMATSQLLQHTRFAALRHLILQYAAIMDFEWFLIVCKA